MADLTGGELKVLLSVVRYTIGWLEDPATGRRREKDAISQAQLCKMTGTSRDTISRAMAVLIDRFGIVQALDEAGNLLDSPAARQDVGRVQRPIFFRVALHMLDSDTYPQNQTSLSPSLSGNADSFTSTLPQNQARGLSAKPDTEAKERRASKKELPSSATPRRWTKPEMTRLTEGYAQRQGYRPDGNRWQPIQQGYRMLAEAGYSIEQIEACEDRLVALGWTWTINTLRDWLPRFVAGKMDSNGKQPTQADWNTAHGFFPISEEDAAAFEAKVIRPKDVTA